MLKVLSLFSGIGAFERAFCRIGLDWELVNYCEIDRWASLSYSMVNQCSESLNLRDVRTVTAKTVRDSVDLITYGFPCQDISIAGKQQGFVNDSGESTRSGLFFEALRIIKELRPRYAIADPLRRPDITIIGAYSMQKITAYRKTVSACLLCLFAVMWTRGIFSSRIKSRLCSVCATCWNRRNQWMRSIISVPSAREYADL